MNLWARLKKFLRGRGVTCDVCGEIAYPLKWGGLLHISEAGTMSVHTIHYIRFGALDDLRRARGEGGE